MRSTGLRIVALRQEANDLEAEIKPLVAVMQPQLLALPGVGAIGAAQDLISWSHAGRFRSRRRSRRSPARHRYRRPPG